MQLVPIGYVSTPMQIPSGTFDLMACSEEVLSYAFQPIVDITTRKTCAFEALVRSRNHNLNASEIFESVPDHHVRPFDQQCRVEAMRMACRLGLTCDLNLNVDPRSFDLAADSMLAATVAAAEECGVALHRLTLEITEGEMLANPTAFRKHIDHYRGLGLKVAIDDFGAGYSGLNLLADFQPDQLKLDRHLVHAIESDGPRQAIVRALVQVCGDLGIDLIAEGVETTETLGWFVREKVRFFQGYLLARPGFEVLPQARFPD